VEIDKVAEPIDVNKVWREMPRGNFSCLPLTTTVDRLRYSRASPRQPAILILRRRSCGWPKNTALRWSWAESPQDLRPR